MTHPLTAAQSRSDRSHRVAPHLCNAVALRCGNIRKLAGKRGNQSNRHFAAPISLAPIGHARCKSVYDVKEES